MMSGCKVLRAVASPGHRCSGSRVAIGQIQPGVATGGSIAPRTPDKTIRLRGEPAGAGSLLPAAEGTERGCHAHKDGSRRGTPESAGVGFMFFDSMICIGVDATAVAARQRLMGNNRGGHGDASARGAHDCGSGLR